MKVLLLAENWEPRIGGIENYLKGLMDHLEGDEVMVVTDGTPHAPLSGGDDLKVVRKRFFWPIVKPKWLPLYFWLKRYVEDEEVDVILCGKVLFEGMPATWLKKKLGIPFVVFTYAAEIEEWLKVAREERKLRVVLSEASAVVCINDVTKKRLMELGVEAQRLVKIYPGVDLPRHEPPDSSPVRRAGLIRGRSRYVLTVARLIDRKGVDVVIKALGQLDEQKFGDVRLVVIGDGPMREELEDLAQTEMLNDESGNGRVQFMGEVSDEELQGLYASAELFVMTPREVDGDIEGFGMVYLEANAHGVPIVGTKTGGVSEAVVNGETGMLVEVDSVEEVERAIAKVLGNTERAQRMGERGKERVAREFTWKKAAGILQKTLIEVGRH